MNRLQFGQVRISPPERRLLAICGGMLRWQPLHVIPSTGTTAMPPRCLRIRSYFATSDLSQWAIAADRSFSSSSMLARPPARSSWICLPSLATTASFSASCFSISASPFLISSYSPASLRISSSAPSLVFLAMSSSRASAAYSRVVLSSERRDSHLRTFSFSSWRSCSFCRRARSLSARRPRCASRAAFASSRPPSICLSRAGCRSACWARSRILRSTFCSSSSALSLSSRDTCPLSPVRGGGGADRFATEATHCQRSKRKHALCQRLETKGRKHGPGRIRTCMRPVMSRLLWPLSYGPAAILLRSAGRDARENSRVAREPVMLRPRESRTRLRRCPRAVLHFGPRRRRRSQRRQPPEHARQLRDEPPGGLRQRLRSVRIRRRSDRLHDRGSLRLRGRGRRRLPRAPARILLEEAVRRAGQLSRDRADHCRQHQGEAGRQHRLPEHHLDKPDHPAQLRLRLRAAHRPFRSGDHHRSRLHAQRFDRPFRLARRDRLLLLNEPAQRHGAASRSSIDCAIARSSGK